MLLASREFMNTEDYIGLMEEPEVNIEGIISDYLKSRHGNDIMHDFLLAEEFFEKEEKVTSYLETLTLLKMLVEKFKNKLKINIPQPTDVIEFLTNHLGLVDTLEVGLNKTLEYFEPQNISLEVDEDPEEDYENLLIVLYYKEFNKTILEDIKTIESLFQLNEKDIGEILIIPRITN